MSLPSSHHFIVNYYEPNQGVAFMARIFRSPSCTWMDVVREWFEDRSSVNDSEQVVLKVQDRVIGWHCSLSDRVHESVNNLVINVCAESHARPWLSCYPIGMAYRISQANLTWPPWPRDTKCPVNRKPLDEGTNPDDANEPIVSLTRDQDNHLGNLMGLKFASERHVIWCNKHALLKALNDTGPLPDQVNVFLSHVEAAAHARSIVSSRLDKSFPLVFDPDLRVHLPIIAFDRFLAWLDLSYTGPLTKSG